MLKPFIVNGSFTRKDVIVSTLLPFSHTMTGGISLFLTLCMCVCWILFSKYKLFFPIIALLLFFPWLLKIIYLFNNLFGNPRVDCEKIEFNSESIRLFVDNKNFKVNWEMPRNKIKKVKYTKNYIYVYNERKNCIIIKNKILSEQEIAMIKDYFTIQV